MRVDRFHALGESMQIDAHHSSTMAEVTNNLRGSLRRQRREIKKLFSADIHPTASSILDHGAELIIGGGGGAFSMRTVAAKAGIKLASLQYHFKTFDELVSALFTREWGFVADILWGVFEQSETQTGNPVEAFRTAVEACIPAESTRDRQKHKIYYHLLSFCTHDSDAFHKAKVFYRFYNTLISHLISRVNPNLSPTECASRATMITSTLEGTCVYTILRAGGSAGEGTVRREIGALATHYAALSRMSAS